MFLAISKEGNMIIINNTWYMKSRLYNFTWKTQTLFVKGEAGISIFSKQLLGKTPFSISLIAAFINGKQTVTASLKSLSWLSSFFLEYCNTNMLHIPTVKKQTEMSSSIWLNIVSSPIQWYRHRWHTAKQCLSSSSNNTWVKPGWFPCEKMILAFNRGPEEEINFKST